MVNKTDIECDVHWKISDFPVPYPDAIEFMEKRVEQIHKGEKSECIWLLEHPPLYTAGTSAEEKDLLTPNRFPVYQTGRGGEYTYHGPGQKIAYIMLDLNKRKKDVRWFIHEVEGWIIDICSEFNIKCTRREGRVGLWVPQPQRGPDIDDKIAAIGIRLRKWVSFHGLSLNLEPNLEHFNGIVPCGIKEHGITSFKKLNTAYTEDQIVKAFKTHFETHFKA
ncbi:MAG: lipoyl(octanoyl) transferase LipB [Rhodomicrobiaceae bacterium]